MECRELNVTATPVYPYRATSPEHQLQINREVSEILSGVNDMLYELGRKRLKSVADEDTIQEMVQECRKWLWQKSLPKYNSALGVKPSTFLYQCARNYFRQEVRSLMRRRQSRRRTVLVDPELLYESLPHDGGYLDAKITSLAEAIHEHPERFLTASQVTVFQTIVNNPGVPMKDLARQLGYQRASSLSMMMRRIRERICQIDVEDYEPEV